MHRNHHLLSLVRIREKLLIIALCAAMGGLSGQSNLFPPPGARSLSTGQTGLGRTDIESVFANPAGLGGLTGLEAMFFAEQRFLVSEMRSVSGAAGIPAGSGAFGIGINYFGFSAYNEQRLHLAYGRPLAEGFHLGIAVNYWQQRVEAIGNEGFFNVEIGMQSRLFDNLILGAHVVNPIRREYRSGQYFPTLLRFGLLYSPSSQVAWLAEVEKDIDFPLRFRTGIDYQLATVLHLRLGLQTAPVQLAAGIGLAIAPGLNFDLGFSRHQFLGWSPAAGLRYGLAKPNL